MFMEAKPHKDFVLIMEEHEEISPEQEPVNLVVSEDIRSYIYETSKWTRFLSIVGFMFSALMVMLAFSVGAIISTMDAMVGAKNNPYAALGAGPLTIILLVTAALYFYPSFKLLKFSTSAKQGVLFGDQESFTIAISNIKSFFKFWGVVMIVVLAFYGLAILFGIIAGVTASMA